METVEGSEKLRELFRNGKQRLYRKNEMILRADEEPAGAYMIESGHIKIYSLSHQGDERVHHFFGPGDFFPTTWNFRNVSAFMYYQALAPTEISLLSRRTFLNYLADHNDVMMEMMAEIVDRYHTYSGRIDNLLYSDARERSAYRLLSLANRFGVKTDEGLLISAAFTHEDLAHSINMTRETFGRSFSRLQHKGIIGYDEQRCIVIKDPSALAELVGREETEHMWPALKQYLD